MFHQCLPPCLYIRPAEEKKHTHFSTTHLPAFFPFPHLPPHHHLQLLSPSLRHSSHLLAFPGHCLPTNLHSPGPAVILLQLCLLPAPPPPPNNPPLSQWPGLSGCQSGLPTAAITIPPPTHPDISWHTKGQRAEALHSLLQLLHLFISPSHYCPVLQLPFPTCTSLYNNIWLALKPHSCVLVRASLSLSLSLKPPPPMWPFICCIRSNLQPRLSWACHKTMYFSAIKALNPRSARLL